MPEINSKRVQKQQQKKQERNRSKSKNKSKNRSKNKAINGTNVKWESKKIKTQQKMSRNELITIIVVIIFLFLFVLWAFVPDKQQLIERNRRRRFEEKQANISKNRPQSKGFAFESSLLLNGTDLHKLLQNISDNEDDERLVLVAFDNSATGDANGDPAKLKLFKKFESVARSLPRKKLFKRYDKEDLPVIVNFDCGNPNDPNSEVFCNRVIGGNTPNVIIYRKGSKPRQLPQDQKSDKQIIKYLYNLMQPPVLYLEEVSDTEDFVSDDSELAVVLFGDDKSGAYELTADILRDFARFGRSRNPTTMQVFDVETTPSIHIWRTFGSNPLVYLGNISDSNSIQRFLLNNYLPLFGEFNSRTQNKYIKRTLPILWIAYDSNDEEFKYDELLDVSERMAGTYQGELSFVKLDIRSQPHIAKNFGFLSDKKSDKEEDEEEEDDDDDDDETDDDEQLPQALIVNNMANIRQNIEINDIENSIQLVINEYFNKIKSVENNNGNNNNNNNINPDSYAQQQQQGMDELREEDNEILSDEFEEDEEEEDDFDEETKKEV